MLVFVAGDRETGRQGDREGYERGERQASSPVEGLGAQKRVGGVYQACVHGGKRSTALSDFCRNKLDVQAALIAPNTRARTHTHTSAGTTSMSTLHSRESALLPSTRRCSVYLCVQKQKSPSRAPVCRSCCAAVCVCVCACVCVCVCLA